MSTERNELQSDEVLLDGWTNEQTARNCEMDLMEHFMAFAEKSPDWLPIADEARRVLGMLDGTTFDEDTPEDWFFSAVALGGFHAAICATAKFIGVNPDDLRFIVAVDNDGEPRPPDVDQEIREACAPLVAYIKRERGRTT